MFHGVHPDCCQGPWKTLGAWPLRRGLQRAQAEVEQRLDSEDLGGFLQFGYPKPVKHGWMGNPRTEWRFMARKINYIGDFH